MTTETYAEQFGEKFQAHILAVCLRVPGFVLRYRSALDHKFFVADVHKAIAKALFSYVDEFKTLPTSSTMIEFVRPEVDEATMSHVEALCEKFYKADISDAVAVQSKVVAFGQTQALCGAVIEAAEMIEKGKRQKVRELIAKAEMVGQDILNLGLNFKADLGNLLDKLDEQEETDTIPTGIRHLDLLMKGGLGRGELGVILAPPKKGKTTTLINLGFGALTSPACYNVVHFSLEMSERKVANRYIDRLMGPLAKTRTKDPAGFKVEMAARAKKFMFGNLFIKGYPTRSCTPSQMRSYLTLIAAQGFHPDLIIVDYADIAKAERRLGELRHEQAGLYEDMRALAGEFNAAMWTGSQGNKNALEKQTITIADFAESFEKAAIVDAAIGFCQTNDEKINRTCRLFAAGLRNADDGSTVECEIFRDKCYIKSKALYDSANTLVDDGSTDTEQKDAGELKDRVSGTTAAPAATGKPLTAAQVKAAAGITKPKTEGQKSGSVGAPKLGTGIPLNTGPQKKSDAPKGGPYKKSGGDRPNKKIGPA